MPSALPQGKVVDGRYRCKRNRAIQMWEQSAATRGFPAEFASEFCTIGFDQEQAGLAGAVPGRAFDDLAGSREMQEPVGPIRIRCAV